MNIPNLEIVERSREYNSYPEQIRDRVVFEYLFHASSHRTIDKEIIHLDPKYSRGYQSMGISSRSKSCIQRYI